MTPCGPTYAMQEMLAAAEEAELARKGRGAGAGDSRGRRKGKAAS
jgi:hypothetical protein